MELNYSYLHSITGYPKFLENVLFLLQMFIGSKYQSSVSCFAYNQYQYRPWQEVAGGCA